MTESEAIKEFEKMQRTWIGSPKYDMWELAIAALSKQIPRIPDDDYGSGDTWYCPACGERYNGNDGFDYCPNCGQAIDWEVYWNGNSDKR